MTTSKQYLNDMTITNAQDLAALWSSLMGDGGFARRSLQVVILDDAGRAAPVIVPIDDIPLTPSRGEVDSFGHFFDHLAGYGTPVLLLSRPGPSVVQEHDRQWAAALAPFTPRWPVHLATDNAHGRCEITNLSTLRVY